MGKSNGDGTWTWPEGDERNWNDTGTWADIAPADKDDDKG